MDNKRKWDYTLQRIADESGVSIHTVRDHRQKQFLIPEDLGNVAQYIVSQRTLQRIKREREQPKTGDIKTDAFGDPI